MSLEQNKQTVVAFYLRAFNDRDPVGAAAAYLGERYIQHNPNAADGVEGFLAFAKASQERAPVMRVEIKRVIAEADHVVTHSRFTIPGAPERSIMDVWRLADGKIVEHWDVIQTVPETAANDNTMF
jgi:predicted SnoaL-like aldol condensation-catalyzing enzyme